MGKLMRVEEFRKNKGWMWVLFCLSGFIFIGFTFLGARPVSAALHEAVPTPIGPDRFTTERVDVNINEWWMLQWRDRKVFCSFFVDYEGLPSDSDISSACGPDLYDEWKTYTEPCLEADTTLCKGFYFVKISTSVEQREVTVKLAPPSIRISLDGCEEDAMGWCTEQPSLVLTAEEPLPNESITSISGSVGNDPFTCEGYTCRFTLSDTNTSGIRLSFWATSSYGDTSEVFDALLRVKSEGPGNNRLTKRWYVNVLSSQWVGARAASCSMAWESFPPSDGLPQWLTTPYSSTGLKSNIPLNYLAANLIKQGITDASVCPDYGLLPDGSASKCGLDVSAEDVRLWQNRFDSVIFNIAKGGDVPAQLLKNLFSRESQFWPGAMINGQDVGLGQMTELGADTAFLWNPSFYKQFCPTVLDKRVCKTKGYANLKAEYKTLLKGALVKSVDARCDDCPLGIDLSRANYSVGVFTHTLLANCEQAGKIIQNVTGKAPGLSVDYETLWKLTLVNYNAGPGCLSKAVNRSFSASTSAPLSWDNIAIQLDMNCPGASAYVRDISRNVVDVDSEPTPTPQP